MRGVILTLFNFLNQENTPYAVLRNYENLPQKPLEGSDIDLLIDEKQQKAFELILIKAIQNNQAFLLSKRHHFDKCFSYFIYQKKPFCFSVRIDAFTKFATKSFIWADSNFLLRNRILHKKGFYILPPGAEAATLFLKEILAGSLVRERYRLKIQNLVKEDKTTFLQTLSIHFNQKISQELLEIASNGKWDRAFKKRKKWWRILILNNIYSHPIQQIFCSLKFLWACTKEYFHFQKGIFIALVGPDGAGKTTISQGIKKRFKNLSFKKIYYYHGQFGFFPELSKVYNFFSSSGKNSLYPTEKNFFNKFRAFLHLFYYGLEAFLSWPWVWWGKFRGKVFLFDRYFYDYAATSIHREIPSWLFFTISRLIPHPDLTFIIYARPEEIYKRKQEWPIEEIRKQLQAFRSLQLFKLSNCFLIDNNKSLETNLDKIENEILKFLKL